MEAHKVTILGAAHRVQGLVADHKFPVVVADRNIPVVAADRKLTVVVADRRVPAAAAEAQVPMAVLRTFMITDAIGNREDPKYPVPRVTAPINTEIELTLFPSHLEVAVHRATIINNNN